MPYVNHRWLGGMLTNFQTISKRLTRLKELEEIDFDDVAGSGFTKKELLILKRERDKLREDPRRYPHDDQGALGRLDRRHQEGAPRGRRGPQARPAGHRDPRHELRPRRGRLQDPRQRRRDPLRHAADPRRRRRRGRGPASSARPASSGAERRQSRSRWPSGSASSTPRPLLPQSRLRPPRLLPPRPSRRRPSARRPRPPRPSESDGCRAGAAEPPVDRRGDAGRAGRGDAGRRRPRRLPAEQA